MVKKIFWKGFLVGCLAFLFVAALGYYKLVKSPDIALAQLELQDLEGNMVEMADFDEKPLVVNYWATWCRPCLEEFPYFEEVKQRFGDDIHFVMISDEPIEKIGKFTATNPYSFHFLKSSKKLAEYGINEMTAIPTTYFYDISGNLIAKHTSALNVERLIELINGIH
ncbi:MAG: TlpA disulfide reductase family protein [Bacteroidota bacterium]